MTWVVILHRGIMGDFWLPPTRRNKNRPPGELLRLTAIDAQATGGISSSLWPVPRTQLHYATLTYLRCMALSEADVSSFYLHIGSINNNCSARKPCCMCSPDRPRKKKGLRKYVDIQNNMKHMSLRLHRSFTLDYWIPRKKKIKKNNKIYLALTFTKMCVADQMNGVFK